MKKIKAITDKIKKHIDKKMKQYKTRKSKIERLEKLIEDNANTINFLIEEKNDYKKKCIALEKEKQDTKQQLRFLTKRDNKLQEIEQLFEKKSLKIRDISKVLESD